MKEIIAVVSRKGGSGKTTTVQAIGGILKAKGKRVLLIDTDAQCNLSQAMGANPDKLNVTDLFEGAPIDEVIQHTRNGDIIAGSEYLDAADEILESNRELQRALSKQRLSYDYIIIDTPASPGRLTMNALHAATSVIITLEASSYSADGIEKLIDTVNAVKKANKKMKLRGFIIKAYSGRSNEAKRQLEKIRDKAKSAGTSIIEPPVRATDNVKAAQSNQVNLNEFAPRSTASQDYTEIVDKILKW